jgi:hypothetical protein
MNRTLMGAKITKPLTENDPIKPLACSPSPYVTFTHNPCLRSVMTMPSGFTLMTVRRLTRPSFIRPMRGAAAVNDVRGVTG